MATSWSSAFRIALLVLLLAAAIGAFFVLPVEKILKDFLVWIKLNLGPWGAVVLAVAYIPLTILSVPAAILSLGGGYLFGLPVGFLADSIGATLGCVVAFLLGRTIGRDYVTSKMNDHAEFQAVATAIERSGFKIVLLLRLAPLVPFCLMNYLLSVTPIGIWDYTVASWLGMMPITLALVYIGTTLEDLADVTHWNQVSSLHWVLIIAGLVVSAALMVCITREASSSLQKALSENLEAEEENDDDDDDDEDEPPSAGTAESPTELKRSLVIRTDPAATIDCDIIKI